MNIIVICTGNRARSQMAEGWLRHLANDDVLVCSAGTAPKGVHPVGVEVMNELGIDISQHTSDHVDKYTDQQFDVAVTVCDRAKEACPVFPHAAQTLHQGFEDPDQPDLDDAGLKQKFRTIRDQIGEWARQFLDERGLLKPGQTRSA